MTLEAVLRQHVHIVDLLNSLVFLHENALVDQSLSLELDDIRRDILICFNDLYKLNEMLITCDGEIKEEIDMSKKAKQKLIKLSEKEGKLLAKKKLWDVSNDVESDVHNEDNASVTIGCTYRSAMNDYISLVGVSNTTLNETLYRRNEEYDEESSVEREKLLKSLSLLDNCHKYLGKEIQQLETLLITYRKDLSFVEKEIKHQNLKVQNETRVIDDELDKIHKSQKHLLSKVGLAFPDLNKNIPLTQKFINLTLNQLNDENEKQQIRRDQEERDIIDHATEFIDLKIKSLQDQLTYKKDDSSALAEQRNIWEQCIQCLSDVENRIKCNLSTDDSNEVKPSTIIELIKEAISDLNGILEITDGTVIYKLVSSEKSVLEQAILELSSNRSLSVSVPTIKKKNVPNKSKSPSFFSLGASPPKISLSDEVISNSINCRNSVELNDFNITEKSKKHE